MKTPPHPIERLTSWLGSVSSLIVHTIVFSSAFLVAALGFAPWDSVLLVVTTLVSLEAIYLAIFIQMSVNRAQQSLAEVEADVAGIEEDIEEISEDIEGIEKDVADIEEGIEEISEDIEGIEKDVAEIEENIDEVSEDIEELQEDIDELAEGETKDSTRKQKQEVTLGEITSTLQKLIADIEQLKQR
jgi:peptidoglycan hydrolase CwlO-like protein